ncbi:MAG: DrmE family protein [Oscillospiraceae bacterium]|nr:DrmE family protein [Oscillospiraceae bacterium]
MEDRIDNIENVMRSVIDNCDICLDGKVISKELLLQTLVKFLIATVDKEKHNVGIVLHTGSDCFNAVMLSFAAISNIFFNETDPVELVESLEKGEIVIYYPSDKPGAKSERYLFSGITEITIGKDKMRYAVLEQQNNSLTTKVPEKSWSGIIRYLGTSTSLGSKGLRRESGVLADFLRNVMGLQEERVTRTIDTSTVIVMSREDANKLIPGISFRFDDKEIRFTELVTASYYADVDQAYQFGSSAAKAEPVIKIAGKVSIARRLLLQREWNRNIGLFVCGEEMLRRGETELPELIGRRSLQYVYLCANIDSEYANNLVDNTESANLFACTKDFLLSNTLPPVESNYLTRMLSRQVDTIIDRQVDITPVEGLIDWETYKAFKKAMYTIKTYDFESDEKDGFIVQAYSLMNLYLTSAFPLRVLDRAIDDGIINMSENTKKRLDLIKSYAGSLPGYLKESADSVVECLETLRSTLYLDNPKHDALVSIIKNNYWKKIAVIVPKAYYIPVLQKDIAYRYVTAVTANQFDNKELYDLIIVLGNITGTRFDPLRCRASANIIVLLYDAERKQFRVKERNAKKLEQGYNSKSLLPVEADEPLYEEVEEVDTDTEEVNAIDEELKLFTDLAVSRAARAYFNESGGKTVYADIVAIARFDSSEMAFFSKNYIAYVLDEAEQDVREVKPSELSEGDAVIFTRSNDLTRDIVDDLLKSMLAEGRLSEGAEEAYRMSKVWKTTLIDYMNNNNLSAARIAEEMIKNGVSVQENTIKGWLDPESHTIGPRQAESIRHIAVLTGNEDLLNRADEYFDACRIVRSIRLRILRAIARAVIGSLVGEETTDDTIFASVSEHIDELATIVRIESITPAEESVPINMINRPVSI